MYHSLTKYYRFNIILYVIIYILYMLLYVGFNQIFKLQTRNHDLLFFLPKLIP